MQDLQSLSRFCWTWFCEALRESWWTEKETEIEKILIPRTSWLSEGTQFRQFFGKKSPSTKNQLEIKLNRLSQWSHRYLKGKSQSTSNAICSTSWVQLVLPSTVINKNLSLMLMAWDWGLKVNSCILMMQLCTASPSLADILMWNRKRYQTTDLQKVRTAEINLESCGFF